MSRFAECFLREGVGDNGRKLSTLWQPGGLFKRPGREYKLDGQVWVDARWVRETLPQIWEVCTHAAAKKWQHHQHPEHANWKVYLKKDVMRGC